MHSTICPDWQTNPLSIASVCRTPSFVRTRLSLAEGPSRRVEVLR